MNRSVILFALVPLACADDFPPISLIAEPRILAIRASEPAISPGETITVDALIAGTSTATFAWSWCPLTLSSDQGYPCAISEAQLGELVEAAGGSRSSLPPYDLGSGATTTFTQSIPPALLRGACEAIRTSDLPDFIDRPKCDVGLPVSLFLTMNAERQRIAFKDVLLLFETDAVENTNPELTSMEALTSTATLLLGAATRVPRGTLDLRVGLDVDQADTFSETLPDGTLRTRREKLTLSWFIEAGILDRDRSAYSEGEKSIEDARLNTWTTPVGEPGVGTVLRVVIRDDRGGVSWLVRNVELGE